MKMSPSLHSYEEIEQWERSQKPIKCKQWFDWVIVYPLAAWGAFILFCMLTY